ncbi:tRNA-uridine aminocarboxypropyltransferase [Corallincola spongiicola]|uniref:tRNA-uridine aminocarboxypropyltransferase n=1 Tax=Corallincola spongiicola TaxID=2520508 RepID=A0ABY1WTJ5_9GAMM|nr:tRNA-uridine aminocarboxypropyltransferase [Corallincola spongiicola]TAA48060.1 DTW domain-containing protein [Corallincola spongiicola]
MPKQPEEKRQRCLVCHYPRKTCVCAWVSRTQNKTQVYVLQHPSEVNKAKGTVRLLQLALSNIKVVVGESESDFTSLRDEIVKQAAQGTSVAVLFPTDSSISVEHWGATVALRQPQAIIVLDGTWRKALKLYHHNPWLAQFRSLVLSTASESQYTIRKAPKQEQLSTLEAVACTLEHLEEFNTQPLYRVFEAMITQQMKMMPAEVKGRYRCR